MRRIATLFLAFLALIALPLTGIGPTMMLGSAAEAATMASPSLASPSMVDCPHAARAAPAHALHGLSMERAGPPSGKLMSIMACCIVLPGITAAAPAMPGRSAVASRLALDLSHVPPGTPLDPAKPPPRA